MFHFKPKLIEASFRLGLPLIKLEVEVYIKGTYGTKLNDYGFLAKLNVTSGHMEVKRFSSIDLICGVTIVFHYRPHVVT